MYGRARAWLDVLVGAFAPRHCAGCDGLSDTIACAECVDAIGRLRQPAESLSPYGPISAAFPYQDAVRRIVHRAKYGGERPAMRALAELASPRLEDRLLGHPDVIVPVPLGRRRHRSRGFNQAAVIAGVLAQRAGIPLRDELRRRRETPSQVGKDEMGRRHNVEDCFVWCGEPLRGATIWLVDDVLTTGSTARAAAAALRSGGAGRIEIAVLAAVS